MLGLYHEEAVQSALDEATLLQVVQEVNKAGMQLYDLLEERPYLPQHITMRLHTGAMSWVENIGFLDE